VVQLSSDDEDSLQELLDLRVACFGVEQDFTNEVDRTLDLEGVALLLPFHHDGGTHYLSSGCDVQ
jgi:predicted GNAT family N-acyltransferase